MEVAIKLRKCTNVYGTRNMKGPLPLPVLVPGTVHVTRIGQHNISCARHMRLQCLKAETPTMAMATAPR
jgi:hypothetical protein